MKHFAGIKVFASIALAGFVMVGGALLAALLATDVLGG
jgi:hypothetical protein